MMSENMGVQKVKESPYGCSIFALSVRSRVGKIAYRDKMDLGKSMTNMHLDLSYGRWIFLLAIDILASELL